MKRRLLVFAFLSFSFIQPSYAIFFAGELTESDSIAVDEGVGEFFYDLYYVVVDVPMTIEVFMKAKGIDAFMPWIGYWDGDFTATPDYDSPPPEAFDSITNADNQLYMAFDALPGIQYQVMAATFEFNPTPLGKYDLFIVEPGRTGTGFMASTTPFVHRLEIVPAPASLILLALGLIIMRFITHPGVRLVPVFPRS